MTDNSNLMKLSIIVPTYNEEKSITTVLDRLLMLKLPKVNLEVIVVDDGSTDETTKKIKTYISRSSITLKKLYHTRNRGKGQAIITGIDNATGEYVIVQDADLEYDPKYISHLLQPILDKKSNVVYGTRLDRLPNFNKEEKHHLFLLHYFGNRFLSLITSILYGQWITDMETGYKVFPKNAFEKIKLKAKGFEVEPEITAKLLKSGYSILEVPITTTPRGYDEGKKLNALKEGPIALLTLIKYRFID